MKKSNPGKRGIPLLILKVHYQVIESTKQNNKTKIKMKDNKKHQKGYFCERGMVIIQSAYSRLLNLHNLWN